MSINIPDEIIPGRFLVQGTRPASVSPPAAAAASASPLLISETSLSFWGGIDPLTGIVVDTSHPLCGICVTDTILCLPSGRGSCTASQVLLELILNNKAPTAFCFRDVDGLACVGAIVADEVFSFKNDVCIPDMIHIGSEAYENLLKVKSRCNYGCILSNGDFLIGSSTTRVTTKLQSMEHKNIDSTQVPRPFTDAEQNMIDNATTEAQRMAYRVLFRYAHLGLTETSAPPTYLDITQAHIDGCTYIGPGGLEFTERLVQAQGKVRVSTTLNSVSADRRHHQTLGVPAEYAANSVALGDAYLALGCQPSFTCAPYLLTTEPAFGDQIAWGESNAVVYANSVLGAHTEKYADYLDICCALTGKVPAVGVHLTKNRQPQVILDATDMLDELLDAMADGDSAINLEMLFPTLGHVCGTLSDGKVPVLIGFDKNDKWASIITRDHLKAFCAAFGTTGTSPLVHIQGVTPETKLNPNLTTQAMQNCPSKQVTWSHCEDTFAFLNQTDTSNGENITTGIDLVALGNPHLSVEECGNLVSLIQGMSCSVPSSPPKKHPNVRIMACLSREIHAQADQLGYIQYLEDFGVEFINDTCWCMLLDPPVIPPNPDATVLTNSGKYAHYGPGLTNRNFRYGSTIACVQASMTGEYATTSSIASSTALPSWLAVPSKQPQSRSYTTFVEPSKDMVYLLSSAPQSRWMDSAGKSLWVKRSIGRYALEMVKRAAKR